MKMKRLRQPPKVKIKEEENVLGSNLEIKNEIREFFNKERKISLHNFFVFFPIDVLILNQNQEIVEIKREFRPFTLAQFQHPGKYVVELSFPGKYELGNVFETNKKGVFFCGLCKYGGFEAIPS